MRRKPVPRRPGLALALRRRPRWRAALVVGAGLLSGAGVTARVQHADHVRDEWGRRVPVVVAARDLVAGELLDPGNTRLERRPAALVPTGALSEVPVGDRLATPVLDGEVLREQRLAPTGLSEVAARLEDGSVAVAVPVELGTTPRLAVGDRVDVLVALAPEAVGGGPPGFVLATRAAVVDVTDAAVTIAVPRDVAPRLAVAFSQGAVSLALVGA